MSKHVNDKPFQIKVIRTLMYLLPYPLPWRHPKKTHHYWMMMPYKTYARSNERFICEEYQWQKYINNKPIRTKYYDINVLTDICPTFATFQEDTLLSKDDAWLKIS